jgi:hypothetical protein
MLSPLYLYEYYGKVLYYCFALDKRLKKGCVLKLHFLTTLQSMLHSHKLLRSLWWNHLENIALGWCFRQFLKLKSTIFWDITHHSPLNVNRSFGETYRLHIQGRRISRARNQNESRALLATCFHAGFLRRYVPPQRRLTFKGLYGVISQKIVLLITIYSFLNLFIYLCVYGLFNDVVQYRRQRWMVGWWLNNEFKRFCKETFEILSRNLPVGAEEKQQTPTRIVGVILTRHFSNASQKPYRFSHRALEFL